MRRKQYLLDQSILKPALRDWQKAYPGDRTMEIAIRLAPADVEYAREIVYEAAERSIDDYNINCHRPVPGRDALLVKATDAAELVMACLGARLYPDFDPVDLTLPHERVLAELGVPNDVDDPYMPAAEKKQWRKEQAEHKRQSKKKAEADAAV